MVCLKPFSYSSRKQHIFMSASILTGYSIHTAHVRGATLCSKRGTARIGFSEFLSKELILYKSHVSRFTLFEIALDFFEVFRVK